MYVCLCRRVTDSCVRAAIAAGACDVEAIRRVCGASAGCGGCRAVVEAMLVAAGLAPGDSPVPALAAAARSCEAQPGPTPV